MKNSENPKASTKNFFEEVYKIVALIPYGRVTSYGAIANALGSAQSSRLVGTALKYSVTLADPVPAHRVVNRIGLLTAKHSFYPKNMQELLEEEGVAVENDRVKNFNTLFWNPLTEININDL